MFENNESGNNIANTPFKCVAFRVENIRRLIV